MVGTHPRTMGGISTVVRGYIEAGLFQRVPSTYVVTHRDGGALLKARTALAAYARILGSLLAGGAPLLHIHLSSRASFWRKALVCEMANLFRRPYLLHVHGSEFMRFYREESGPRTQRYIASVFRRSSLVLALSEEWRASLLSICPRARVEVLSNAVPLPKLDRRPSAAQAQTVLFMGRLGQRKGVFDLVKAFARVAPRFPLARLVCAGDGEIDEVKRLSQTLGMAERVTCPGWLDTARTQALLASASIFVLPSYAEGLPMALLEAMSWGLPVIASPVGGIPQVVRQDDNGLLVDPGDVDALSAALERLLAEAALRDRLGRAARQTVEKSFALPAAIARLTEIYGRFGIEAAPIGGGHT
jgi:glycosyltransferase involved in cell wall biosynthesis